MNFPLCLTAVVLLFVTSLVLVANAYPHYEMSKMKENFILRPWNWNVPGWGPSQVPWYSHARTFWQYPFSYQQWQYAPGALDTATPHTPTTLSCPAQCSFNFRVCDQFKRQMQKYNQCLADQAAGKSKQASGIDPAIAGSCEEQYGCRRSDFELAPGPPVNPSQTGCVPCWNP